METAAKYVTVIRHSPLVSARVSLTLGTSQAGCTVVSSLLFTN